MQRIHIATVDKIFRKSYFSLFKNRMKEHFCNVSRFHDEASNGQKFRIFQISPNNYIEATEFCQNKLIQQARQTIFFCLINKASIHILNLRWPTFFIIWPPSLQIKNIHTNWGRQTPKRHLMWPNTHAMNRENNFFPNSIQCHKTVKLADVRRRYKLVILHIFQFHYFFSCVAI